MSTLHRLLFITHVDAPSSMCYSARHRCWTMPNTTTATTTAASRWRISLHLSLFDRELRFNINQYWNNQSICIAMNAPNECKCKMCTNQSNRTPTVPTSALFSMQTECFAPLSCSANPAPLAIGVCGACARFDIILGRVRSFACLHQSANQPPFTTSQVIYSVGSV